MDGINTLEGRKAYNRKLDQRDREAFLKRFRESPLGREIAHADKVVQRNKSNRDGQGK